MHGNINRPASATSKRKEHSKKSEDLTANLRQLLQQNLTFSKNNDPFSMNNSFTMNSFLNKSVNNPIKIDQNNKQSKKENRSMHKRSKTSEGFYKPL